MAFLSTWRNNTLRSPMPLERAVSTYSSPRIWETALFMSIKFPEVRKITKINSGSAMWLRMLRVRSKPSTPGDTMPLMGTQRSL